MGLLVAGLVLPVVVGFAWVSALWPASRRPGSLTLLKLCLALGLGWGAASWGYFLWLLLAGASGRGLLVAEAVAAVGLLAAAGLVLRRARPAVDLPPRPAASRRLAAALTAVLVVVVVGRAAQAAAVNDMAPHGYGDAHFIWNLKARFLYRGGDGWRVVFATPNSPTGELLAPPDYPLLLPATVARAWVYRGAETTTEPAVVAVAFTLAGYALLYAGVAALRGRTQGALAALLLAGSHFYAFLGGVQVADVPFSFFVLAAAVLFALHDTAGGRRWVVLAGATVGLAGWTKNEGLLLIAALVGARAAVGVVRTGVRGTARELAAFALGLAVFGGPLAYYRLAVAPPNYLVRGQDGETLARLTDPARYQLVFGSVLLQAVPGHRHHKTGIGYVLLALPVYRLLVGRAPVAARRAAATPAVVLGLVLAGYAVVYLATPLDLGRHLASSLHRLVMHVWPLALFAFFLGVASPEEAAARGLAGPVGK